MPYTTLEFTAGSPKNLFAIMSNLLLHLGRLTGIGILQQEGATRTALLAAAIALLALTGLPMSDDIGALTVGAV